MITKKIIGIIVAILLLGIVGTWVAKASGIVKYGYNKQILDVNYNFNKAQISLPDGRVVGGNVDSWTDFTDGDQIQITIDGKTYLTDTTRCVLWYEEE